MEFTHIRVMNEVHLIPLAEVPDMLPHERHVIVSINISPTEIKKVNWLDVDTYVEENKHLFESVEAIYFLTEVDVNTYHWATYRSTGVRLIDFEELEHKVTASLAAPGAPTEQQPYKELDVNEGLDPLNDLIVEKHRERTLNREAQARVKPTPPPVTEVKESDEHKGPLYEQSTLVRLWRSLWKARPNVVPFDGAQYRPGGGYQPTLTEGKHKTNSKPKPPGGD